MTGDHPLNRLSDGIALDCGHPGCDICSLGPLPGEDRPAWMARLTDRFRGQPIELSEREINGQMARARRGSPGRPPGPAAHRRGDIVICPRCHGAKAYGHYCGICHQRPTSRRGLAAS